VCLKPLADGSSAVGMFNMGGKYKSYNLLLKQIGINKTITVRDIWKQKNIAQSAQGITFNIPPHGVRLIKIIKGK
jgi:alpha-galactosidase